MMIGLYAFGATILMIFVLSLAFRKIGWMDKPHLYGHQREPVPYGVGIVFFLIFLALSWLLIPISNKLIALWIAGGLLSLVSFWDDRVSLPAWPRFGIQILCALVVIIAGVGIPVISNPLGDPFILNDIAFSFELAGYQLTIEPLADLVALLWIVFLINAMNWLDGVPGMVSGISTISSLMIYLLATMSEIHVIDQADLAVLALVIGGASLAFLCFDFPKPKLLMGDSGTMFLGFIIAVMAIFSGGKLATAFIVLAIPLLDAIWTIIRRILKGQSPFRGDFQHFHHELMRAGLSERQVNFFYYLISLSFGGIALYLQSFGKLMSILLLFSLMALLRVWISLKRRRRDLTE